MKGLLKKTAGTGKTYWRLTNEDYDTLVEFEIIEKQVGISTFKLAKIKHL